MRRHKIVARIIRLIRSAVNFALAALVLVLEIPEVRVDVLDEAEDLTTTGMSSGGGHQISGGLNVAGQTNTPPSPESTESKQVRSKQVLVPHNPRSPIDSL